MVHGHRRFTVRPWYTVVLNACVRVWRAGFGGVRRRFEHLGSWGSSNGGGSTSDEHGSTFEVHVYDDYAHHPTEVAALVQVGWDWIGWDVVSLSWHSR